MLTKKQIAALNGIVASRQQQEDSVVAADNEFHKNEARENGLDPDSAGNRKPHVFGQRRLPNGQHYVTNNYVAVLYQEQADGVVCDESLEQPDNGVASIFISHVESSNYWRVSEPFDGKIQLSKIRAQIKANQEKYQPQGGASCNVIQFRTTTADGREMSAWFNTEYVRLAIEAVGKNPVVFIGRARGYESTHPSLLVESEGEYGIDEGFKAIVMPIARRD